MGSGDFASSTTALANVRLTVTYCSQSDVRKIGRTWAIWHNGHSPSFANP